MSLSVGSWDLQAALGLHTAKESNALAEEALLRLRSTLVAVQQATHLELSCRLAAGTQAATIGPGACVCLKRNWQGDPKGAPRPKRVGRYTGSCLGRRTHQSTQSLISLVSDSATLSSYSDKREEI